MTATLGEELVLDVECCDAGARVLLNRAPHVERVAVAGIRVRDHGYADRVHDGLDARDHFACAQEPEVGHARAARDRTPARVHGGEAGRLDELGREPVEDARRHDDIAHL